MLITHPSGLSCNIERLLGEGGQGEVYLASLGSKQVALKWYFPSAATREQHTTLEMLIRKGRPNDRFLWPLELVVSQKDSGFGYIMPLREARYKSIVDLMRGRIQPTFSSIISAGMELAHSFLQLHTEGLCYRDISFGNVFFDPNNGEVLICDNDNVGIDGQTPGGILGTPRFMAPEVVRGEAHPNTQTDIYSLAVLLFYLFMVHHPLEGKRETEIHCFDLPAMTHLYGSHPLFIFDPHDDSNRPVPGQQDNALLYWQLYPQFLRDLFTQAFTKGIQDPQHGRVRESEWRAALARLRDTVFYCPQCSAENFYDDDFLSTMRTCWACKQPLNSLLWIRIGSQVVMLNSDTHLYQHHLHPFALYDFSKPLAEVSHHPQDKTLWGLKNLSENSWKLTTLNGDTKDVPPGRSAAITPGARLYFGEVEGEFLS